MEPRLRPQTGPPGNGDTADRQSYRRRDSSDPGFLLKALRDDKLYLFQLALASLASLRTDEVRAALASDRPELLALACAAVGIDRSVFPTILSLVRGLNDGHPTATPDSLRDINAAFALGSPTEAREAFLAGAALPALEPLFLNQA